MGRSTQVKNEKKAQAEDAVRYSFVRNNVLMKEKSIIPEKPLELDIAKYSSLAIRDIKSFTKKTKSKNRDKQVFELVRYAFGKYPVCSVLADAWNIDPDNKKSPIANVDMKLWYICAARGGSLYKEHAKDYLSKKEVHNFLTCPHSLNMAEGLIYSVAKSMGASEGICLRIARSKIREKTFTDFWKNCVRFFAENTPDSVNAINDLTDFLQSRIQVNRDYTIFGNTLASLTKKMHDWHWELQRVKAMGDARWEGVGIADDEFIVKDAAGNETKWHMRQIKNSKDLAAEGTRMRHCVYSYKYGCVNGTLSIWSLSKEDQFGKDVPKVTIELRNEGYIAQARGLANRATRPEEKNIIRLWCARNHLRASGY